MDWSQYNEELVKRGECWLAPPLIKDEKEEVSKKKLGRPPIYSQQFI